MSPFCRPRVCAEGPLRRDYRATFDALAHALAEYGPGSPGAETLLLRSGRIGEGEQNKVCERASGRGPVKRRLSSAVPSRPPNFRSLPWRQCGTGRSPPQPATSMNTSSSNSSMCCRPQRTTSPRPCYGEHHACWTHLPRLCFPRRFTGNVWCPRVGWRESIAHVFVFDSSLSSMALSAPRCISTRSRCGVFCRAASTAS